MAAENESSSSPQPSSRQHRSTPVLRVISISALTAGGLALGGIGLAAAADTSSSPTPSPTAPSTAEPSSPTTAPDPGMAPGRDGLRGWGPGGRHGGGHPGAFGHRGLGGPGGFGALHGSFVTAKPGGGYQTIDTQRGKVSAVSDTSITVKSDDGFTKTYAVPAAARVDAARDGISTVKADDEVAVIATEENGTATALSVVDLSRQAELRQKMAPAPGQSSGSDSRDSRNSTTAPSDLSEPSGFDGFEGATSA